jgi:proline iminopeptidase
LRSAGLTAAAPDGRVVEEPEAAGEPQALGALRNKRSTEREALKVQTAVVVALLLLAGDRPSAQPRVGTITVANAPLRYVREGSGPTVVAIGSAIYFPKAYSTALRRQLDMVFVDSRHFVPSYQPSREQLAQISLETFADDLEAVRQQLGIERWAVIGHSIHAQIAIAYARKYPQRTSHLVIICGVPFRGSGATADSFFKADASAERKAALAESTRDLYWANPLYDATRLLAGLETGPAFTRLQEVALAQEEARQALQEIKVPTLVVVGKLDYAVPYFTWNPLIDGLSNVSLVVLDADSHNPQTESPHRFDPILLSFLKK